MADWKDDIEKYKRGELSASEMHRLEKKALNDPFLAEALEGTDEISAKDFSGDLVDLRSQIRENKIKKIWTPLRIAASISLILGVSFVMYFVSNESPEEKLTAQNESFTPPLEAEGKGDSTVKDELLTLNEIAKEKQDVTSVAQQPVVSSKPLALVPQDDNKNDKLALTEKNNDKAQDIKAEEEARSEITEALDQRKEEAKIAQLEPVQSFTVDSVSSSSEKIKTADRREVARAKKLRVPSISGASQSGSSQMVKGQVTSAEDGLPLPGVNVVVKGTSEGAITDTEGNYSIRLPEQNSQLVFSFIGLQSKEVSTQEQTSLNVQMNADASQLSEVVITGYGTASDKDEPSGHSYSFAEPAGGKRSFKKYLETNLRYPSQAVQNKTEGKVTIEFTVKTNGTLTDFRVVKGIGSGCDEEVIRLVKEGPAWSPSTQDEKIVDSQMRVNLRFKLPK
jgi:TonB family protein